MSGAKVVYSGIKVSGDRTKGSIFSQMLTKLSQYTFGGMEQLTRESTFSPEELGFGKKPIALFLQVPFYDRSKSDCNFYDLISSIKLMRVHVYRVVLVSVTEESFFIWMKLHSSHQFKI